MSKIEDIDVSTIELTDFEKRGMQPRIEGNKVRVSGSRICFTKKMDREIGAPERVMLSYNGDMQVYAIRPTEVDGYKVQRQSNSTSDVASKAFIERMHISKGIYDAAVRSNMIVWVVPKDE